MTLNSGTVQSSWWMDAGYLTSFDCIMWWNCCAQTRTRTKYFNPHKCKCKFQHYTLFNIMWLFFTYALNYCLFCKVKHSQFDSTFTALCQNVEPWPISFPFVSKEQGFLVISEAHQSLIRNSLDGRGTVKKPILRKGNSLRRLRYDKLPLTTCGSRHLNSRN